MTASGLITARRSLATQGRILLALMIRESKTHIGRSLLSFAWIVVEPALHVLVLILVFKLMLRGASPQIGVTPYEFFSVGILSYFFFSKCAPFVMTSLKSNNSLLYYPAIKHEDLFLGRYLYQVTVILCLIYVFWGASLAMGWLRLPDQPLRLIAGWFFLSILGLGFGILNAVILIFFPVWTTVMSMTRRILYFTSGVIFVAYNLPPQFQWVLYYNPLFHAMELCRSGYTGSYHLIVFDPWYLVGWSLILPLMGLSFLKFYLRGAVL